MDKRIVATEECDEKVTTATNKCMEQEGGTEDNYNREFTTTQSPEHAM